MSVLSVMRLHCSSIYAHGMGRMQIIIFHYEAGAAKNLSTATLPEIERSKHALPLKIKMFKPISLMAELIWMTALRLAQMENLPHTLQQTRLQFLCELT